VNAAARSAAVGAPQDADDERVVVGGYRQHSDLTAFIRTSAFRSIDTDADDGCDALKKSYAASGLAVDECGGFGDNVTGWEIRAGIDVLRFVGVSAAYGRTPAITRIDSGPFGTSGNLIFKDTATVTAVKSFDFSFEGHARFGFVTPYFRYGWMHSTFSEELNQSILVKTTGAVSREQNLSRDFDGWNPVYGAGANVALTRCVDLTFGWRRLKLSDSDSSFHYNQWMFGVGLRKGFGRLK